ncbi:hypothetical protein RUM43_009369 [Polyplax serrata]|uniref:Katanin p80 WD40 repeat-containing subunit B1 n=1 Tax=Polyplax serrata TaxID=468196 RepID=A0AAN8NW02_POLSC
MATSSMRSIKLQEFVAHEAKVNCLALGQISGRVLVTGGNDKKVNLWAIGTTNYVLSLNAHTSPVECVKFGHTEEFVCSGSEAGELYIWDLEANKKTRTFIGHKDGIRCMDFHPYGDFLASGSLDTSIKLWDLRRKGCISNYRGHILTVNSVRFSPDGLWLASGGDDGVVKIWDVRIGRLLQEFPDHFGSVLTVEFHPHEFLLASGSSDGTVNFWDLEKFQLVSKVEKEQGSISCLHFSPEGECLYAGVEDYLKVFGWEPGRMFDSVLTSWGVVQDMVKTPNQLIGASFHKTKVMLQAVDTKLLKTKQEVNKINSNFVHCSTRKSFTKEKLSPPKLSLKMMEESGGEEEPVEPTAIFQPQRTLTRTPPPVPEPSFETDSSLLRISSPTSDSEPLSLSSLDSNSRVQGTMRSPSPRLIQKESPPQSDTKREHRRGTATRTRPPPAPSENHDDPRSSPRRHSTTKVNSVMKYVSESRTECSIKANNIRHSPSDSTIHKPPVASRVRKNSLSLHSNGPAETVRSEEHLPRVNREKTPRNIPVRQSPLPPTYITSTPQPVDTSLVDDFVPLSGDKPCGISMDDFLPVSTTLQKLTRLMSTLTEVNVVSVVFQKNSTGFQLLETGPNISEAEGLSSLVRDHNSMMAVLCSRQKSLRIVYSLWHNKDAKAAIDSAVAMANPSVLVDLLGVLVLRPPIWTLDICGSVLPPISELLQSKYEL